MASCDSIIIPFLGLLFLEDLALDDVLANLNVQLSEGVLLLLGELQSHFEGMGLIVDVRLNYVDNSQDVSYFEADLLMLQRYVALARSSVLGVLSDELAAA